MIWKKTTIGEHCTVTSSKRFHLSERTTSGVPFYCSKEIIQIVNGEDVTDCDYITEELYESVKNKFGVPETGDLLITTRGTYGIPYLYSESDRFYFADGNLTWLKDFDSLLLPKYLYYWIKTYEGQKKIEAIAKGTAQKAVPISLIKTIDFLLPSVEYQKRVVNALSAYDDLIENNRHQIKLLEEAARRLYREWFVDFRFPGHEQVQIVDGVPEGWEKEKLGDIVKIIRGRSYSSLELSDQDGILMVNLSNIHPFGGYEREQEKLYTGKHSIEQEVKTFDLIMGVTDMTQERRTVGRVALIPDLHRKAMISMDIVKLNSITNHQVFLYSLLRYGRYSDQISRFANGTNVLHLKPDSINLVKVILPGEDLQVAYEKQVKNIYQRIFILQDQIKGLKEAKDAILPRLML